MTSAMPAGANGAPSHSSRLLVALQHFDGIDACRSDGWGDAGEADVPLHVVIDPVEVFDGERRAGGEDRAELGEIVILSRLDAGFFARGDVFGAGAEDGDAEALGDFALGKWLFTDNFGHEKEGTVGIH